METVTDSAFDGVSDDVVHLVIVWTPLVDVLSLSATCKRLRAAVLSSGLPLLDHLYMPRLLDSSGHSAPFFTPPNAVARARAIEAAYRSADSCSCDREIHLHGNSGSFNSGTLRGLIEHLTGPNRNTNGAIADRATVVITWSAFTKGEALAAALCRRFHETNDRSVKEAVANLTAELVAPKEGVTLMALGDDADAMKIIAVLSEYCFARHCSAESLSRMRKSAWAAATFSDAMERHLMAQTTEVGAAVPIDASLLDPAAACNWWRRYPPRVVAEAMTVYEQAILFRVGPRELVAAQWRQRKSLEQGFGNAPNMNALVWRFNALSHAVAAEVLSYDSANDRAAAIERAVAVATEFRAVANYQHMTAVVCALGSASVQRLRGTWPLVRPDTMKSFREMSELCDVADEYRGLRHIARGTLRSGRPCLPYLGVFLLTLAHVRVSHHGTANETFVLQKWRMCSDAVAELLKFLTVPYQFEVDLDSDAMRRIVALTDIIPDQSQLFALSLQREPRQ